MTDEEYIRTLAKYWCMDYSEMIKIIHGYIESDICNEYYRLTYSKPPIYISPVKVKSLKERLNEAYYQKEDNKMNATSVQNIKNVKDISFLLAEDPDEMGSNFTIIARTNDDIFKFEFEGGLDLLQSCKAAGLFTGWEKDQKIRELEQEKENLKEHIKLHIDKYDDIVRKNSELQEKIGEIVETDGKKINQNLQKIRELEKEKSDLVKALGIMADKVKEMEEKKDE